jgi:hypothetical protein
MDKSLHSTKGAPEQMQLKSCSSPNAILSTLAESNEPGYSQTIKIAHTLSEQPGYFPPTENITQIISVQPGYFSHSGNTSHILCEQPGYSCNTANTVHIASELPGNSSHATQSEQFYHEIADEESTSASPVTDERPVQLPRLFAYAHGPK